MGCGAGKPQPFKEDIDMTKKVPAILFNAVFDRKFEAPDGGSTLLMCKGGPKGWREPVDIVNLQTGEVLFSMSPAEGGRKRVFTDATAKVSLWSWSFCEYAVHSTKNIGCFIHDGNERLVMFASKDGTSTIDGTLPVKTADGSDFSISVSRVDGLQRSCSRMRTSGTGTNTETAQKEAEKLSKSQLREACEKVGVDKADIEKADGQDSKDAYMNLLMPHIQAKMDEGKDMVICKEYSNQKMWMSELKATQAKRGIQDESKDNIMEASTSGFQFLEVRPGVNLALALAVIIPARQCFEWYYSQFFDPSNAVPDSPVDPVNSTLIVPETHKP